MSSVAESTRPRWAEQTGEPCPRCRGAGIVDEGEGAVGACPACGGSGEAEGPEDPAAPGSRVS